MSTGFQQTEGTLESLGQHGTQSATKGTKPFLTNLTAKDFGRHKLSTQVYLEDKIYSIGGNQQYITGQATGTQLPACNVMWSLSVLHCCFLLFLVLSCCFLLFLDVLVVPL